MAICPSYIGARRLRVTRLDNCGRPVYGQCSQGVSDGFVSIEFSPEVQEGEDYTQRNANGELCVSERGPDTLQWINVSIEFCRVDAELWRLMNSSWKAVRNARGEVTGFRIGEKISSNEGFALEVWPKASGQGTLCDDDAPEDAVPGGYFLLPYVVPNAPDSWTLEDGVATFTLTGRTKAGSLWGRGPYNVTHDINGQPTPLLEPIESGAGNEDPDHFHADIVTLAPPEPFCGCQPLEAMAPGALNGEITLDPDQPNQACFTVSGSPGRRTTIDWGDGSDTVTSRVGREECHVYTTTGTYTVTVSDIEDTDKSSTYTVEITEIPPLPNPVVSVTPTEGTAPLAVDLSVDNHSNGQVTVDWGDGTPIETLDGNGQDEGPATHPHQYTDPGDYTITVTAVDDDRAQGTAMVSVTSSILAAPTAPTTTNIGETEFTLTWQWERGNGPEATGFTVEHRMVGDTTWIPETISDPTVTTHPITGLDPNTEYETRVRADNSTTQSDWSDTVTATTSSTPLPPDDPTNVAAVSGVASGEMDVSWDWAAGEGPAATGFEVRWRTPAGTGTWSDPVVLSDPAATVHTITGLTPGEEYEVGVTALNNDARSSEALATGTAAV